MQLTVFNLLAILTFFQGTLVGAIFFFRKKGHSLSNKIFGLLIWIYTINLFTSFARSTKAYTFFMDYHKPIYILSLVAFLIGPLLFFFVRSMTNVNFKLTRQSLWHFIPFFMAVIYALLEILSTDRFILWFSDLYKVNMFALLVQLLVYIILSFKIGFNKESAYKLYNQNEKSNLNWIKYTVIGFIAVWYTKLQFFAILMIFKKITWCAYTESIYYTAIFIIINFIAILGHLNPKLIEFNGKKNGLRLDEQLAGSYLEKIIQLLEQHYIYKEPELSLSELGKKLDIHVKYLSYVINKGFGKSFIELINEYRIKESIEEIKADNSKEKSIKEICYDVGFNSRSAFNNAFKRYTGLSPTDYRKKMLN